MKIHSVDLLETVIIGTEIGIEIAIEKVIMTDLFEITNLGMGMETIIATSINKTTIETIVRETRSLPEEMTCLDLNSASTISIAVAAEVEMVADTVDSETTLVVDNNPRTAGTTRRLPVILPAKTV